MIISFVIPVYNTGAYLPRCIDSILSQDTDKSLYEIIIINDGSTDNSGVIIDELASTDSCVKVIHSANEGLGAARNKGIKQSSGKYIFFLDPDDYILDGALRSLIDFARTRDFDIIGFNWQEVYPDRKILSKKRKNIKYNEPIAGAEYLSKYNLSAGVCFYLYSGSLLRNKPILMPEGIYHEDELFIPVVFTFAEKIIFVDRFVYAYYQRADSVTNRKDTEFVQIKINDSIWVLDQLMSFLHEGNLSGLQQKGIQRKIAFLTVDIVINLIRFQMNKNIITQTLDKLEKRKLYPFASKSYGWRYSLFRMVFNSRQNVCLASKAGLFKKS
ncbi:glycosyltransferase [Dysgonomonas sp. OttesenSCG-928-M03]|nr:glycosyltransferase [Dysgonomonas sp. OttesenSCG-928-M03]